MAKSYRSFTLLELLVVIAIIATLISLVTVGINYIQARSRDMQRLEDIRNIQIALDSYYQKHGDYPKVDYGIWASDCKGSGDTWSRFVEDKLSNFVERVPHDPLYSDNEWPLCYYYKLGNYHHCSGDHEYTMIFAVEVSAFDLKKYGVQGENGTRARYCLHPDEII